MIEDKKFVSVIYDLFVDGENGSEELMERATEDAPLQFVQGIGMMLPKFEAELAGKAEGEGFDFRIAAADAYGEYDDEGVLTLARQLFEIDGVFDSERVRVGNIVPMTTADGQIVQAQVVEITDENVTIDLNHPLAGENLHFVGKVIEVRDATDKEIAQLTQGCGCGCGRENCDENQCCGGCGK